MLLFKTNAPSLTRTETANPPPTTAERLIGWWLSLPRPVQWATEQLLALGLEKLLEIIWRMLG
jgi:hypothetical protein